MIFVIVNDHSLNAHLYLHCTIVCLLCAFDCNSNALFVMINLDVNHRLLFAVAV